MKTLSKKPHRNKLTSFSFRQWTYTNNIFLWLYCLGYHGWHPLCSLTPKANSMHVHNLQVYQSLTLQGECG